jgi:hypothetical protein
MDNTNLPQLQATTELIQRTITQIAQMILGNDASKKLIKLYIRQVQSFS